MTQTLMAPSRSTRVCLFIVTFYLIEAFHLGFKPGGGGARDMSPLPLNVVSILFFFSIFVAGAKLLSVKDRVPVSALLHDPDLTFHIVSLLEQVSESVVSFSAISHIWVSPLDLSSSILSPHSTSLYVRTTVPFSYSVIFSPNF